MNMQCAIQENHIMFTGDAGMLQVEPVVLQGKFREAA